MEQRIQPSCPSIEYRTRREILREPLTGRETAEYQQKILGSPGITRILEWQNEDGYFGTRLHTAPTGSQVWPHEGCVRYLLEMGVQPERPPLRKALGVLLASGWQKEGTGSRAAQAMGFPIIRASLFAQAGLHGYDFVQEWTEASLQAFRCVAGAEGYRDLAAENKRGKLVFLRDNCLPTVFHMRMLAYTDTWRTAENQAMVAAAFEKLYAWLPLPPAYIQAGSQLVAPLGSIVHPVNRECREPYGFWWFHFHELAARMGMLGKASPFRRNFDRMDAAQLERFAGAITRAHQRTAYTGWGAYSGLALNPDWKRPEARISDLAFRLRLTRHWGDR